MSQKNQSLAMMGLIASLGQSDVPSNQIVIQAPSDPEWDGSYKSGHNTRLRIGSAVGRIPRGIRKIGDKTYIKRKAKSR